MLRPCFLVVDQEFSASISTRKLVIETAKFNVITAYSSEEAIETLAAFPAVNGAVVDEHMIGAQCADLVAKLKQVKPGLTVIAVGTSGHCGLADYFVEPFSPEKLLALLKGLQPEETDLIRKTSLALSEIEGKRE